MRYIVMTCPSREHFMPYFEKWIPDIEISLDTFTDMGKFKSTAFFNWQQALSMAGDDPCVQMEDDILFAENFLERVNDAISKTPDMLIQFFSMRQKDLTIGSRIENGSTYLMNQCYYLPKGMAKDILEYSHHFYDIQDTGHAPTDECISSYLSHKKLKYLIHVPSLVQHRKIKSVIDPRRGSGRQSITFKHKL